MGYTVPITHTGLQLCFNFSPTRILNSVSGRAVDPHSLYTDPDPAVFLNADPDPDPDLGPGLAEPNLKKKIMNSFLKL